MNVFTAKRLARLAPSVLLSLTIFFVCTIKAEANSCVGIATPFSIQGGGSLKITPGGTYSSEQRLCFQLPSVAGSTSLLINGASVAPGGSFNLYVPQRSTNPDIAAVFTLRNSTVDAKNAPLFTSQQLSNQVSGRLRVNILDTNIGAGRTLSFVPNGGSASPTELYIGSTSQNLRDRQFQYRNLKIQNATIIEIGSYTIDTSQRAPINLNLADSEISGAALLTIRDGSQLYTNSGTSIEASVGVAEGVYAGAGTFSGQTFYVRSTGTLSPEPTIGTLQFNSDISFSPGSRIIAQVDPTNAAQKADLISSSGALKNIDDATIVVQASRRGLTAQDYVSGGDYAVATASSIDGQSPTIVAGSALPALAIPSLANNPAVDNKIVVSFATAPVSQLPQIHRTLPKPSVGGNNIASSVAVTASGAGSNGNIISAGGGGASTLLTSGANLTSALNTLSRDQLASFDTVHAEAYSSHLTVALEQMEAIGFSVLRHANCGTSRQAMRDKKETNTSSDSSVFSVSQKIGSLSESGNCQGHGIWLDTSFTNGRVDGEDGLGSFEYNLKNVVAGVDLYAEEDRSLGLFLAFGQLDYGEHDQVDQEIHTDDIHAGLYGRINQSGYSLRGLIGVVRGKSASVRNNEDIGQFSGGTATSSFDSSGFYLAGEVSRKYTSKTGLQLHPRFGLSFSKTKQAGLQETGGGDFNYSIDKANSSSFVTSLGVDISRKQMRNASAFNPIAFARLDFDLLAKKDREHEIVVHNLLFGSHTQTGQNRGPLAASIGLGLQARLSKQANFSSGYTFTHTSNGFEHSLGANFAWEF
jgi:hypothetical protein